MLASSSSRFFLPMTRARNAQTMTLRVLRMRQPHFRDRNGTKLVIIRASRLMRLRVDLRVLCVAVASDRKGELTFLKCDKTFLFN
jgi:hypothetical protein